MSLTYCNPVWHGYFADPFVMRWRGSYYAYGTGGQGEGGCEKDGRIFPVLHSNDLAHWKHVGGALKPRNHPDKPAYWAPEVAERAGTFYLYYSAGGDEGEGHQLRVATSDLPEGPFEDTACILMPDEPFSIDAHPYRDPVDGCWYLFFAKDFFDEPVGTGTAVVRLADDMVSVVGATRTVVRASADWQVFTRDRFWYGRLWPVWHTVEGPSVVAHDGKYYCFYSGGRWETEEYGVSYAVADSALGPYVDADSQNGPSVLRGIPGLVLGPGHNSVVMGPDSRTQLLVYHAWDPQHTARRMCIDPLRWTPDGPRCDGPTYTDQTIQC